MYEETESYRSYLKELKDELTKILAPGFKLREGIRPVEIERFSADVSNLSTRVSVGQTSYRLKGLSWKSKK